MAGAEFGGAEAFFSRLVPALAGAGVEQRVVIRRHRQRAARLREAGLEPVELAFGGPLDLLTPLRLKRQIKAFKPDIVLTWMNRATAKAPRGDFVHVGRLGGYYDLKYYAACDHLIANTEDIVRYLVEEGWSEAQVHCLPNFVDAAKAPSFDRKALYVPDGAPLVLALGRLHRNKAFDVLIEALAKVPGAYLCLAGEGPCRGELETLAERLGVKPRIRFLGWREDTAPLFAAADVLVCPSRHEPLGNVVVEAWAHDVPVIAAEECRTRRPHRARQVGHPGAGGRRPVAGAGHPRAAPRSPAGQAAGQGRTGRLQGRLHRGQSGPALPRLFPGDH